MVSYYPETGQFTQPDPIGIAGGLNLYGYAGGDPVNFSDPYGLCPWCITGAIGAAVGAASAVAAKAAINAATSRPFFEGTGAAAILGGVAGGIAGATLGLASPASAAIVTYDIGIGLVGVGASLPSVPSAVEKLRGIAERYGRSAGEIANDVLANGRPFLDNASGHINYLLARPDGRAGFVRVTTDVALRRIISAGWVSPASLANGIANGRFIPK